MTNRFVHLIHIPVTGVGIRPFRGQEWYTYRLEILKKYTLNSLLNQSNRAFTLWLSFRKQELSNPLTLELQKYLSDKKIPTLMTFDGLPYYDDKFNSGWKEKLLNLARIIRMAYQDQGPQSVHTWGGFVKMILTQKFPINFEWKQAIGELFTDKNETLRERLRTTLGNMRNMIGDTFDWVYVSRIDSDDMFHQDFVREVQQFPPFPGALTCRKGYVYDSNTGKLAEWNPKTNPPFHTIIFPGKTFFDPARYLQYFKSFRSHEDIPNVFNSQNLKDGRYCVLIHNQHISTVWDHPWKGKEIEGEDKENTLVDFGIKEVDYFKMDGLRFDQAKNEPNQAIREIVHDYLSYREQGRDYEPETTRVIKQLVKEGDVCVDVGASIGYMTMQLARASKTKVLAFEPTSNQCEYIEKNAKLNGYEVEVFNNAAWDNETDTYVRRDTKVDRNFKDYLNPQRIQVNAGYENKIKGIVLDNVLPEKVDFIKMDIDGSEPRALKGLIKTFERNPQLKMIVEYYPKCIEECNNDPKEMMAILDKYFTYQQIPGDYGDTYWNFICHRK